MSQLNLLTPPPEFVVEEGMRFIVPAGDGFPTMGATVLTRNNLCKCSGTWCTDCWSVAFDDGIAGQFTAHELATFEWMPGSDFGSSSEGEKTEPVS